MWKSRLLNTICSCLITLISASSEAAIITIPNITNTPNNDDVTSTENLNAKWYGIGYGDGWSDLAGSIPWTGGGYDIEESGGTTEYYFNVTVQNGTGIDWSGYSFMLALDDYPVLIQSIPNDGFDFDTPFSSADTPSSSSSALTLTHYEDELIWSGLIPDGTSVDFWFSIDVPDGLAINQIWIMEKFAAVPIPASAWLFGSGLLGLVGLARKKL